MMTRKELEIMDTSIHKLQDRARSLMLLNRAVEDMKKSETYQDELMLRIRYERIIEQIQGLSADIRAHIAIDEADSLSEAL